MIDIVKEVETIAEKHKDAKGLEGKAAEYTARLDIDKKFWDEAGDDEPSTEQKKSIIDNNKRIEELSHQIAEAKDFQEQRRKNAERLKERNTPGNSLPHETGEGKGTTTVDENSRLVKNFGAEVMNDPAMQDWLKSYVDAGMVKSGQHGRTPIIEQKLADIISIGSSIQGGLVPADRTSIVDTGLYAAKALTILDLVTRANTNSQMVEFIQQTGYNPGAVEVGTATSVAGSSGIKPMSDFILTPASEKVKQIAVMMAAPRSTLADVPYLQALINQLMNYDINERVNGQMVNGGGTGNDIKGILQTSGRLTQSYVADPAANTDAGKGMIYTLRKARTKVQFNGRSNPTAYALNPLDWEAIDLTRDAELRYYFGGPTAMGTPRLWGLPVVQEEDVAQGKGICAEWRWAWLWMRENITMYMTDSHADFFARNLIAILAEMRAAFALVRPQAFCEVTLA